MPAVSLNAAQGVIPMFQSGCLRLAGIAATAFLLDGTPGWAQSGKSSDSPKDDREPINCVMYTKYDIDTHEAFQGDGGQATNKDRKDAAAALKTQYDAEADKTPTEVNEINSDHDGEGHPINTYEKVLQSHAQTKKCCRRIDILAHGKSDGSLALPYDMEVSKEEESQGGVPTYKDRIGGQEGKSGLGVEWVGRLTAQMKAALCPPPVKPRRPVASSSTSSTITLYACYLAGEGGLAPLIAKGVSVNTTGYTGSCDFISDPGKPQTVFTPTGATATFDPKGHEIPKPDDDKTSKKDDKPVDQTPKKSSTSTTDSPPRTSKSAHRKTTKSARRPGSETTSDSGTLKPAESGAIDTVIGIGVGVGLGMGRGGGHREMNDR